MYHLLSLSLPHLNILFSYSILQALHTTIHLFIEDRRSDPPRRSAVDMNIRPTDVQELESEGGVVRSISAKQVTVELQKSFSALSGVWC